MLQFKALSSHSLRCSGVPRDEIVGPNIPICVTTERNFDKKINLSEHSYRMRIHIGCPSLKACEVPSVPKNFLEKVSSFKQKKNRYTAIQNTLLVNVVNIMTFGLELFNPLQNDTHSPDGLFVFFLVAQVA